MQTNRVALEWNQKRYIEFTLSRQQTKIKKLFYLFTKIRNLKNMNLVRLMCAIRPIPLYQNFLIKKFGMYCIKNNFDPCFAQ